jgi:hypothetical protein
MPWSGLDFGREPIEHDPGAAVLLRRSGGRTDAAV